MNSNFQLFDDAILPYINTDAEIETVSHDCLFTEGPVWNKDGYYLFSDITANAILKWTPGGEKKVVVPNSGTDNPQDEDLKPGQGGSDGLTYDNDGTLLVCRHGSHMVAKWSGKALEPFISSFEGRPLNSPNDIVVDADGRVFFSDPPYGLKDAELNREKFQQRAAVYCYDRGELTMICDKYAYPNGVCITPGGDELYICSNKPFEKFISVYDLKTLSFRRILAEENSDGIKCDPHGNVYLSNKDGILILNPEGKRQALIQFETVPANHCFGGPQTKDLLVTARQNVFLVRNLLR